MYGNSITDEDRLKFLDYAYERGQRFWDTGTYTYIQAKRMPHGQEMDADSLKPTTTVTPKTSSESGSPRTLRNAKTYFSLPSSASRAHRHPPAIP